MLWRTIFVHRFAPIIVLVIELWPFLVKSVLTVSRASLSAKDLRFAHVLQARASAATW
jgi:hypothetical protein